jgi:hypothetical protein
LTIKRDCWNASSASGGYSQGYADSAAITIRNAFMNGGGLVGFDLFWNLGNKFPAGVTLEVWGR